MQKILNIKTSAKNYQILVSEKSILSCILQEKKKGGKIFIIIDDKTSYLIDKLNDYEKIKIFKIKASEKIKSINNYSNLILNLIKYKIDRNSTIIAIGGGTVGDLSGFIASTVLRGVSFILIPTTLLSQVDSSIGGKNGLNTKYGKNLIGTFFQPNKVIIDISALKTLPIREIRSGYAEILKHAVIHNSKFYLWLCKNYSKIMTLEKKYITKAIIESIKIKRFYVQKDEEEKLINNSSRAMLNFGHTFGHALEAMNKYTSEITHGEAITVGMALAIKISKRLNKVSDKDYDNFIQHLKNVGLPSHDKRTNSNKFINLMMADKKNSNNKINLILLNKIGSCYFERNIEATKLKKLLN